jgi:hypothetical protein
VRSLTKRRVDLERTVAEFAEAKPGVAPPHATRGMLLWLDLAVAELAWLRETIEEVRDGGLAFAPGDNGWTPPDDPGRQMQPDREKYRALLER